MKPDDVVCGTAGFLVATLSQKEDDKAKRDFNRMFRHHDATGAMIYGIKNPTVYG